MRCSPGKALQPPADGDSSSYRRQRPPRERPVPALPLGQAVPLPPPLHVPVPRAPSVPFHCCCSKEPFASLPRPSPVWAGGRGLPSQHRVAAVPQEGTALWQVSTRHTYTYKHPCFLRGLAVATFSRGSDCDPLVLDKEPNPRVSPLIPRFLSFTERSPPNGLTSLRDTCDSPTTPT